MSDHDEVPAVAAPREGLAVHLRQLEAFVAQAQSEGDVLPPEAMEMVARLREIMAALDGLTTSIEGLNAPIAETAEARPPRDTGHAE